MPEQITQTKTASASPALLTLEESNEIARADGRAPRALCGCRLATTEKKIPERPVEFVAECSPDNIPGNLVGRRNQCDRPRVDYVEIEVAEIVVQIFGPHQPVAVCVFNPPARRPPPRGLRLAPTQTAPEGASDLRDKGVRARAPGGEPASAVQKKIVGNQIAQTPAPAD